MREFSLGDVDFIIQLLNSPGWLRFIGDRKIRTAEEAEKYINNNLILPYRQLGFGFWCLGLKPSGVAIGMCGLIKRDYLDYVDIGYALLPEYFHAGYAFEACCAVKDYAIKKLKLNRLLAITDHDNVSSTKLLAKLGFEFEKMVQHPDGGEVCCFSNITTI